MLRRLFLYCVIGLAFYLGYAKYMEYASGVHLRATAEQEEENRRALQRAREDESQSKIERALRRRETTEQQANQAERQVKHQD